MQNWANRTHETHEFCGDFMEENNPWLMLYAYINLIMLKSFRQPPKSTRVPKKNS